MAPTSKDTIRLDVIKPAENAIERPLGVQEPKTDIEHSTVKDDPRKWANSRKVSGQSFTAFKLDSLLADRRSHHRLRRIYGCRLSRQHTKP